MMTDKTEKRFSELTDEDKQYNWLPIEQGVDNPLCIRGVKKIVLPKPPEGMEWVEITAMGDSEQKFILGGVLDNAK